MTATVSTLPTSINPAIGATGTTEPSSPHSCRRSSYTGLYFGYGMIGIIGIPLEYGRYMHQYTGTYSMHIC